MAAGPERDALVRAKRDLERVAQIAIARGEPYAALAASEGARRADAALGLGNGCKTPGCDGEVIQSPGPRRPREYCLKCSPRKNSGKMPPASTLVS